MRRTDLLRLNRQTLAGEIGGIDVHPLDLLNRAFEASSLGKEDVQLMLHLGIRHLESV